MKNSIEKEKSRT